MLYISPFEVIGSVSLVIMLYAVSLYFLIKNRGSLVDLLVLLLFPIVGCIAIILNYGKKSVGKSL